MLKFVKFVTGEELVSYVEDEGDSFYLVWPARVYQTAPAEGEETPQTHVTPFAPHVKGHSFSVDKSKVLYTASPIPSLAEYYKTTYGSMIPGKAIGDEEDDEQGEVVEATSVVSESGIEEKINTVG